MVEAGSLLQIPEMDKKGNTQPSQPSPALLGVVGRWRGKRVRGSDLQTVFPGRLRLLPTSPCSHAMELKSQLKVPFRPGDVSMLFLIRNTPIPPKY